MRIVTVAITARGAALGGKVAAGLPGELYVAQRYADSATADNLHAFEPERLKLLIASLWRECDAMVLIMATGIVVRTVASLLESKQTDPAVVVMDEAGRYAIPLLSGHLGGGNALAIRLASLLGAEAVITTATDVNGLPSFDLLAKEMGWIIDDISRVKLLNRLMLDGEAIAAVDPGGCSQRWLGGRGGVTFYETFDEAIRSGADGFLFVTNQLLPAHYPSERMLLLRPRNLVLGIGCNRGTPSAEIEAFVSAQLQRLSLSPKSARCIASVAAKRDEVGLEEYARQFGVPLRCFESDELKQVTFPSPPSEHALAAVGVAGVAEPAAILASGGGHLLLKKVKSGNVTLAIAELAAQPVKSGDNCHV